MEDEAPHSSWRDTYHNAQPSLFRGASTRLAIKDPLIWTLAHALPSTPKTAMELIREVREFLEKSAGDWEYGSGGSTSGVYAMTPKALGIPGGNLGGMSTFQGLAAMQMRPTFGNAMTFGGGGVGPLLQNYQAMGRGDQLVF